MQIRLQNLSENAVSFMRSCGYSFERQDGHEINFMRRLHTGDYPRFHAYVHSDENGLIINLHLDQKKPSYAGSSAHNGEYDGDLIESEAERIKSFAN